MSCERVVEASLVNSIAPLDRVRSSVGRHVRKLLGHKDLTTTTLYAKADTSSLAAMLRRSRPRER